MALVYVHTSFSDPALGSYFEGVATEMRSAPPDGMLSLEQVRARVELENLAATYPLAVMEALPLDRFPGLGLWTVWTGAPAIHTFYRDPAHRSFSRFAIGSMDRADYFILQYVDGGLHIRDSRTHPM